jgi:acyl-CoA hydrolase
MNPFDKIAKSHQALAQVDLAHGRSIASSRSTSSRLMELIDANARGTVHGGVIMRMVDEAASIVAFKHSQNPDVVTAKVETFTFLAPAYIRDVLTIHCAMHYVGRTSMEVGVEVLAEDVITGKVRHIASSYLVYVALNENGQPTPVPPLVPADDEEKVIIEQARLRRLRSQKTDEELMQAEEVR